MGKKVFIAEKPSVAQQFADALGLSFTRRDGYMESQDTIVTWCVGHLVTMSYPEAYDPKYKTWSLDTIPFLPDHFRYEVIDSVKKQYKIVSSILTSGAVDTIYICTDSGREGEYIYRLVAAQAGVKGKRQLRVWIDSQTKEEILRGIREARDDSEYDCLGSAAYLRAKEDYLMGINFSRALSLRYSNAIRRFLGMDRCVIAVGRVMTCVLGIVVRREREIRSFVKTPFYRVTGRFAPDGAGISAGFDAEWSAVSGSRYENSPLLYKENGFKEEKDARALISWLQSDEGGKPDPAVRSLTHKKETRKPPLLYNLAELQNDCSRFFKISPDQTLAAAQELYEKKLTTYPRTDARVLSSAVAKEIDRNLKGIGSLQMFRPYVSTIAHSGSWKKIGKTRYTNDSAITDHYAIIPTGQGFNNLASCSPTVQKVYECIVRRFLAVFYPPAVFDKIALQILIKGETFNASVRTCRDRGYLDVMEYSFFHRKKNTSADAADALQPSGSETAPDAEQDSSSESEASDSRDTAALEKALQSLKKGDHLQLLKLSVREGETTPPKRYNSGSMILTMENAGQFIEDEELREQIRGSGIGTSATRADILKKLVDKQYLDLNRKTQIYTPTQLGEMIYDTVEASLRPMLDPRLTASWEKGLTMVAEGTVTEEEYMDKLTGYITRRTNYIKETDFTAALQQEFIRDAAYYPRKMHFCAAYTYSKKYGRSSSGTKGRTAESHTARTRTRAASGNARSGYRATRSGSASAPDRTGPENETAGNKKKPI